LREFDIKISPDALNEKKWRIEEVNLILGLNLGVYCDAAFPVSSQQ
jgi:hypothetical protein